MAESEKPKKTKNQRVSLSPKQLEESAALELLTILQLIVDDGYVSDSEIGELKAWSVRHPNSQLPGALFLNQLVSRILADGVVTDDERKELLAGIEKVLPPDVRSLIVGRRREKAAAERASAKEAKEAERQQRREEKERNRRIDAYDIMIAGATKEHHQDNIDSSVRPGKPVYLKRELDNPKDRNAIRILNAKGWPIGYVPREYARDLATLLDDPAGNQYVAAVKKVLGYERSIPVVEIYVYGPQASIPGALRPGMEPEARGCLGVLAAIAVASSSALYCLALLFLSR